MIFKKYTNYKGEQDATKNLSYISTRSTSPEVECIHKPKTDYNRRMGRTRYKIFEPTIMLPFFKTSKTTFLISSSYDTDGNSFSPLNPKLLIYS